jgi:hypothetical protein
MFKAFKPEAMNKIANAMGYSGDMGQFQQYIEDDPARKARMNGFVQAAQQMAKGGVVKMQAGGTLIGGGVVPPIPNRLEELQKQVADAQERVNATSRINYKGAAISIGGGPSMTDSKSGNNYQGFYDSNGRFRKFRQHPDLVAADSAYRSAAARLAGARDQLAAYQKEMEAKKEEETAEPVPPLPNPEMPSTGMPVFPEEEPLPPQEPEQPPGVTPKPITDVPVAPQPQPPLINKPIQRPPYNYQPVRPMPRPPMDNMPIYTPPPPPIYNQPPPTYNPQAGTYTTGGGTMASQYGFQPLMFPQPVPFQPSMYRGEITQQPIMDITQQQPPQQFVEGGYVRNMNEGGDVTKEEGSIGQTTMQRMYKPALPEGGVTVAAMTPSEQGQYIDPRVGQVGGMQAVPTATASTTTAMMQPKTDAAQMQAVESAPRVNEALQATQAAQTDPNDPRAKVLAEQQLASSVSDLSAAQGTATLIDNPVQRQIQSGELISGAAADATTAAQFTEQVQAATATPTDKATVQGQLASLTQNFDAANPPSWAAGAMRSATAAMAARGLGASSLAGQAIVQATLEAALPIAQADAATQAQFESQNLTNRQQRAMLAAQQRATFMGQEFDQAFQARVQNAAKISDIANMNFTAEQQVQLENSRAANTMNLNNLSNNQAMTMAEASALAQMDASNLNNRQQAAVQNAQTFLQQDMANLSNRQQTDLFKAQQRVQSMFTDQAAQNAARQFNATSQQQTDQFFANLNAQTSQFNAAQSNAQSQFNAGQRNTVERFNAELMNQRDTFNAQNQLVISQSNAQWRRQVATADTAAVNRANEINAQSILDVSKQAYDNLWNYYADTMEWAWTSAESAEDRATQLAIAQFNADSSKDIQKMKNDYNSSAGIGKLIGAFLNSDDGSVGDSIFNSITSWF